MADNYDPLPDLGRLLDAALRSGWNALPYVDRLAENLSLGPSGGPEAAERALRDALAAPRTPDEDQPLTCVRCWHSPASRLLVIHWREETIRMLCGDCAEQDAADAPDLPGFRMATMLTIGTTAAVSGT